MKATLLVFAGLAFVLTSQRQMAKPAGDVQPVDHVRQKCSTQRRVVAEAIAAVSDGKKMRDLIDVLSRASYQETVKPPSGNAEFVTTFLVNNLELEIRLSNEDLDFVDLKLRPLYNYSLHGKDCLPIGLLARTLISTGLKENKSILDENSDYTDGNRKIRAVLQQNSSARLQLLWYSNQPLHFTIPL